MGITNEEAKKRYDFDHPNILKMYNYFEVRGKFLNEVIPDVAYDDNTDCNILIFEMFHKDLKREIAKRNSENRPFEKDELWNMSD